MSKEPDWLKMAEAVRNRRGELGLTQDEVVERMDPPIGIQTYRRVEAGDQPNYRPTTLAAVARALDWPSDMLTRLATGRSGKATAAHLTEIDRRLDSLEEALDQIALRVASMLPRQRGRVGRTGRG